MSIPIVHYCILDQDQSLTLTYDSEVNVHLLTVSLFLTAAWNKSFGVALASLPQV